LAQERENAFAEELRCVGVEVELILVAQRRLVVIRPEQRLKLDSMGAEPLSESSECGRSGSAFPTVISAGGTQT
jgi:hypothetical protein